MFKNLPTFNEDQHKEIIKTGFSRLKQFYHYKQTEVELKMRKLGFKTNKSTFNKIIKGTQVSLKSLFIHSSGMQELVKCELCLEVTADVQFKLIDSCEPKIIELDNGGLERRKGFHLYEEGRLELQEKVNFLVTAESEIIEFGTTLNAFSNYLLSQKEKQFKQPIKKLLKKGVTLKCYLLDPTWNGTSLYCEDRENFVKEGQSGIEKIRTSLRRLKQVHKEFEDEGLRGKFEVYTYRHIPHNYFMVIDRKDHQQTKMMVSNYLYGMRRADCPVMKFTRQAKPILYQRYLGSLEKLMKGAKKVNFNSISD